jgi:hypothetical protein
VISPEHSHAVPPVVAIDPGGLSQAAAGHNWYPAIRRCGCGLSLPNARHWTSHVAAVTLPAAPPLPLVQRL